MIRFHSFKKNLDGNVNKNNNILTSVAVFEHQNDSLPDQNSLYPDKKNLPFS